MLTRRQARVLAEEIRPPDDEAPASSGSSNRRPASSGSSNKRPASSGSGPVAKAKPRVTITRPFFHQHEAGWTYYGTPLKEDFSTDYAGSRAKNCLWHELKQLLGGTLIGVTHDRKERSSPNDPVTHWKFQICDYIYKCRSQIPQYFASIDMLVEKDKDTKFVFNIDNPIVAEKYQCTPEILRRAAVDVFATIILKSENPDGRRREQEEETESIQDQESNDGDQDEDEGDLDEDEGVQDEDEGAQDEDEGAQDEDESAQDEDEGDQNEDEGDQDEGEQDEEQE